ncbi:hypothetical protein ABE10_01115 [Bacillus toyonensis]|nr:hypothetical protein [Bacillus toyonensis]
MSLVAGDEHDSPALTEKRQRRLQDADLRVAVQAERIILAQAGLHAARGVEDQDVKLAELSLHRREHLGDRGRLGEVGPDDQRTATELANFRGQLLGTGRLVPVVDHDVCARVGEVADRVGADPSGRAGDESDFAGQGFGRQQGLDHDGSSGR